MIALAAPVHRERRPAVQPSRAVAIRSVFEARVGVLLAFAERDAEGGDHAGGGGGGAVGEGVDGGGRVGVASCVGVARDCWGRRG